MLRPVSGRRVPACAAAAAHVQCCSGWRIQAPYVDGMYECIAGGTIAANPPIVPPAECFTTGAACPAAPAAPRPPHRRHADTSAVTLPSFLGSSAVSSDRPEFGLFKWISAVSARSPPGAPPLAHARPAQTIICVVISIIYVGYADTLSLAAGRKAKGASELVRDVPSKVANSAF